ncbi:MAG: efflux RND transporter periplasmic adaptor subunit [Deltaproteobacteria bacterium]|nr:MAG: efflux RND transporter periplasmic adaptor subunit [Deltaproteobacteria bacterium]TMQ05675.1 MAG: efflux RND transporter periplasmic adaptor subunit [Deltaproteobacteria bacterium]
MQVFKCWLVLGLAGCSPAVGETVSFSPPPSTPRPDGAVRLSRESRPYVVTEKVAVGASSPVVLAPARIAFRDGAVSQVNLPIAGRVTAVYVKTGDRVKIGAALVAISSPDAAAARAQLAAAAAEHDAATHEIARQDAMATSGVGVESERVAVQAKLRQSEAELARAQTTVAILGGGGGSTVVLRAPIDGTVIARHATVGAVAQPGGDPLIEIGNPSSLWVVADVFERELAQVHDGAAVDIELPTRTAPVAGHVVSVGQALTGALRTAPVYIALDGDSVDVRSGMFARARIKAPAGKSIVLPAESVLIEDGKTYVVFVKTGDDLFTPRKVEVGRSIDGRVEVLSGVAPGEDVVVKGALLLDGAAEQLL